MTVLPCSPSWANWLRYGIQLKSPGPALHPGHCPAKAHDRECLGVGGRRALVSRHWTGKTLAQHKADRAEVFRQVLEAAGIDAPDARRLAADVLHTDGKPRFVWEDTQPDRRDYPAVIAASLRQARHWRTTYDYAKAITARCESPPGGLWTAIQQSSRRRERAMDDKLLNRISEVAHHPSLSRSKVYEMVRGAAMSRSGTNPHRRDLR